MLATPSIASDFWGKNQQGEKAKIRHPAENKTRKNSKYKFNSENAEC